MELKIEFAFSSPLLIGLVGRIVEGLPFDD